MTRNDDTARRLATIPGSRRSMPRRYLPRAVLPYLVERKTPLVRWVGGLLAWAHKNVVVVALANKLARIASAVLTRGCTYDTGRETAAA